VPDEFIDLYVGDSKEQPTNLVAPGKTKYTSTGDYNSEPVEVIGGPVPPGDWRFIERDVPGNENDPLEGTMAFVRGIEILAKATVTKPGWAENTTAYSRQLLEVRDAPLFAHAIFYNMPMEIAPGPPMQVHGNVHSNGDMYLQSNHTLTFYEKVTSAGEIYHGRRDETGMGNGGGDVRFVNGDGEYVSMKEGNTWEQSAKDLHSGTWLESTANNWYEISSQLFDGNVLNKAHGVEPQNPVGVMEYIEDTNPTTSAKESVNPAYQLIQPVLNNNAYAINSTMSEDQVKHAQNMAEVERQKFAYKAGLTVSVKSDGALSYYTYERDATGNINYDSSGNPKKVVVQPKTSFVDVEKYNTDSSGKITSGLFDKREGQKVNVVEINVGKLKDVVHKNESGDWNAGGKPSDWWNGVVYVEFPQQSSTTSRPDNVNPAIEGWAVKVANAQTIPSPKFAQSKGIYGTSFATNSPLYIDGHYNADGNTNSGSPTEADTNAYGGENVEAPSAIAADAITFLSTAWDDANSNKSMGNRKASSFTEVSAAILAGNVPSGTTGNKSYSGGVENFPRFLEDWGGKTLRIRGSLVALYESEVADAPWGSSDVYSAPNRNWGFHEKLSEGYYPPGTPSTRTYRGRDYRDLNLEEYEDAIDKIKSNLASL
ncbi:MAG: hypothetical protein ACQKBV_01960, partial [Puniceicoccales bacterium]